MGDRREYFSTILTAFLAGLTVTTTAVRLSFGPWPVALWLGGSERLILTFAVFVGGWAAWQMHTMGAADGKIAVALAAVSPMALGMGVAVLAGMFAGLWVWKRCSVSVPAAVGLYVGIVGWMVMGWLI